MSIEGMMVIRRQFHDKKTRNKRLEQAFGPTVFGIQRPPPHKTTRLGLFTEHMAAIPTFSPR